MGLLSPRRLSSLLLFAAIGLLVAMWYYTNQLNQGAFVVDHTPLPADVRVTEISDGRIRIAPLSDTNDGTWKEDGLYGLEWPGGYGRMGRIIDTHPDSVLREFTQVEGSPAVGTEARVDTFVYRGDPRTALGFEFQDVNLESPEGRGPAWFIPGNGATWLIFVHGKGSSREESLRVLSSLRELQMPTLVPTYRNDENFTSTTDDRYRYGETEWRDIATAMDYGRSRGAERFVLIGNSMGGSIIMSLLRQPEYAPQVAGVVLDAPMLDLKRTVQFRAAQRSLPSIFTNAAMQFASWRSGIEWTAMDYLSDTSMLSAPILLIHGDKDRIVPFSTSETLATARADIVTFRKLEGIDHVQGWNRDRELYGLHLRDFIKNLPR